MFRRKEENATDSTDAFSSGATSGGASSHAETTPSSTASAPTAGMTTASASAPSSSGSSHSSSPYAPTTSSSTAPARTSASSASTPATGTGGSYRPTPIADFTRGASPRASEPASRPAASSASAASSFGSAASEKTATKTNRRVLTVGNDILLKGEIATCDRLVIEGRVEAKLSEVHTVEIAECGSFKGTAEVEDAEISGVFEGDLVVRNRLVIYATGEVRGNISYGEIEIERGGRLTGQIKTVAAGTQGSKLKTPAETASTSRKEAAA